MPTYVAFLRAINLGANRKFPQAAITAATEAAGGRDVATWINTGNVRLASTLRSRERVEEVLEKAYLADRGFEVKVIGYTVAQLQTIAADVEELYDPALARHYVLLLKEDPSPDVVAAVEARARDGHRVVVRHRAAHLLLGPGYEAGGVDPMRVEKLLGVATNRNHTVIRALAERWL